MLDAAGAPGIEISLLPIRTGFSADEVKGALEALHAVCAGDRVISFEASTRLEDRIAGLVSVEMANHLLEAGVSLQTLRSSVHAPQEVIDLVVNRLVKSGRIEIDGSLVRPKGWESRLNEREQSLSDAIMHAICIQPLEPPSVGELEARFGRTTVALLRRLERQGEVERVSDARYYSRGALAQMVGSLRSSLESGRKYSPSELRDVLGVSRKFLIPFLEFCDRRGVTERNEAGRVLRGDGS
jgi:selenocysteine-specific elongation factor